MAAFPTPRAMPGTSVPPPSDFVARPCSGAREFLEDGGKVSERWLGAEATKFRRETLGMNKVRTAAFAEAHEFVSLGCACGVARALQALNLVKFAYPFDWVRSSAEGVIHCLDKRFEDFLTFSAVSQPDGSAGPIYTATGWGGSFWHHDPLSADTTATFTRRAERFLGLREVAPTKPRIFVRALNATKELETIPLLLQALRRVLPSCDVRFLVLVDCQKANGLKRLKESSGNELLFYFLRDELRVIGPDRDTKTTWTMQKHCEDYAKAIAAATACWAGEGNVAEEVQVVPDLASLVSSVQQWDGGSAASELFSPRKIQGRRLIIRPPPPPAASPRALSVAATSAATVAASAKASTAATADAAVLKCAEKRSCDKGKLLQEQETAVQRLIAAQSQDKASLRSKLGRLPRLPQASAEASKMHRHQHPLSGRRSAR
eukprot:gnl/TRDRNA2_/TRDRNA2_200929_c0_seq1.p1 gnl/TRDRNA2_/TRDRNA2_200929_c0~~gnl/TRDRNA2_/TRDRNA2_200929_c0_seq1.p1  ORF type:complete len:433 (-),score=80.74 gnl/TRDRNA2_/TRDRNA2_200929_c0_seq1:27-1325(-)